MVAGGITSIVEAALEKQSKLFRRKDVLAGIAGGIMYTANALVADADASSPAMVICVSLLIMLAQGLVHGATQGAITPSMGPRLEQVARQAAEAAKDAAEQAAPADEKSDGPELPVYSFGG